NRFISYPSWSEDMTEIVFISLNEDGEGIWSLNPETGEWKNYIGEGRDDLQSVRKRGRAIFFVSSTSGIDNAHMMEEDGDLQQITTARFGISDISLTDKGILFADYSVGGNDIAAAVIDRTLNEKAAGTVKSKRPIDKLNRREKLVWHEDYTLPANYKKERYSKIRDLFRFHSWMPIYADINNISFDDIPVSPGAMVMTQNNLSTLISTLGYEYTGGEHLLHSNISWKGWYPAVDFNISYGGNPVIYNGNDTSLVPSTIYNRLSTSTTVYIPLRFYRSRFIQTFWPSMNVKYSNKYVLDEDKQMFDYGQTLLNPRLYFSNLHKMSHRDIWPRYGQVLDLYFTTSLFDSDLYGPVTTLRTAFYFPGIFQNHGIKLKYQYEKHDFRRLLIHNRVSLPRGYTNIISENINSFSVDYAFPVAYPDFHPGNLLYVNRIRNTIFYDYAISNNLYDIAEQQEVEGKDYLSSAGVELLADFYILRIPVKLSAGLQAAYLPFEKSSHFKFLLNMDVFGFVLGRESSY
ncbi:MAG: TolB family protein, partial [Bacteroidota bacterium]